MGLKYSNNRKVLVIDDDENVSEMLRDSLELRGYKVEVANSGFLLGAKEYIVKPFSLAILEELIQESFRNNSYASMTLQ